MKKLLSFCFLFLAANAWSAPVPPVQKCENGGFTSQASAGCTMAGDWTLNSLRVYGVFIQTTTGTVTSCSDSSGGNTYNIIGPTTGANNRTYLIWSVSTSTGVGAPRSVSCNLGGGNFTGDFEGAEYTGMAGAATVFDCSSGSSGNSASLDSGNCTPTAANDLFVGFGAVMQNSATATAGSGYTLELNQAHSVQGNSCGFEDKNGTSCSAQSAPMTMSVSGQWGMLMAAFKTNAPTGCLASGSHTWK